MPLGALLSWGVDEEEEGDAAVPGPNATVATPLSDSAQARNLWIVGGSPSKKREKRNTNAEDDW